MLEKNRCVHATEYEYQATKSSYFALFQIQRDPDSGNSKGFAFINYASFEASDAAIEAMNGQYLCNRAISISYAFKKDSKGERHGSAAERLLAAQNPLSQADRPHQLFADAPPMSMGGGGPPGGPPGLPPPPPSMGMPGMPPPPPGPPGMHPMMGGGMPPMPPRPPMPPPPPGSQYPPMPPGPHQGQMRPNWGPPPPQGYPPMPPKQGWRPPPPGWGVGHGGPPPPPRPPMPPMPPGPPPPQ